MSAVIGGTLASREWERAIKALMRQVGEVRGEYASPLQVGVTFHIPGEVSRPKFGGVRTGGYDEPSKVLVVQIALPEQPEQDADREVRELLKRAVNAAEEFARRRGIAETLPELRELLAALGEGRPPDEPVRAVPRPPRAVLRRSRVGSGTQSRQAVVLAVAPGGRRWEDPSEDLLFILLEDLAGGGRGPLRIERLDAAEPEVLEVFAEQGSFRVRRQKGDRVAVAVSGSLHEVHAACTRWAYHLDSETAERARPGWGGFDGTLAWQITEHR